MCSPKFAMRSKPADVESGLYLRAGEMNSQLECWNSEIMGPDCVTCSELRVSGCVFRVAHCGLRDAGFNGMKNDECRMSKEGTDGMTNGE
jgi:hypothetical protein